VNEPKWAPITFFLYTVQYSSVCPDFSSPGSINNIRFFPNQSNNTPEYSCSSGPGVGPVGVGLGTSVEAHAHAGGPRRDPWASSRHGGVLRSMLVLAFASSWWGQVMQLLLGEVLELLGSMQLPHGEEPVLRMLVTVLVLALALVQEVL